MNIAYSCNDNYISHTGISMISVMENNKDVLELNFYFISKGCSQKNVNFLSDLCLLYHRTLIVIDFDDIAFDLNITSVGRHIETIYSKVFFSRINGLEKIIYLDSDIVVVNSLKELWETDLTDCYLGAVQTITKSKDKLHMHESVPFFNDGMALINVNYCRSKDLINQVLTTIDEYHGNPPVLSEGALNKVCQGHVKFISLRYNLMSGMLYLGNISIVKLAEKLTEYTQDDIVSSINNPVCIHYLTSFYNRPWLLPCTHPYKNEYLKYKLMSPWRDEELIYNPISLRRRIIDFCFRTLGVKLSFALQKLCDCLRVK